MFAWVFANEFDGGGLAGMFLGAPIGGLTGCIIGTILGTILDRRGGLRGLRLKLWHLLIACLMAAILVALIRYMASIRPFYWVQT